MSVRCCCLLLLYAGAAFGVPALQLSQTVVTAQPGTQPSVIQAYNGGDGNLSVGVSVPPGVPWLTVSVGGACSAGPQCVSIQFTFNTAGWPDGTYSASVSVFAPGALNSPQTVIAVTGAGQNFAAMDANLTSGTMCDLYSPAPCNAFFGTAASASAQDGGEWISVSVSYDYVATLYCLGSSMLDIHLAPSSNMAPGTYTGNVSSGAAEAQQPPENTPVTMRLASQTLAVPSPSQIGVALMQGGPALTYPFVPGISLSPMGAIPATSVVASGAGLSASVSGGNVIVTADPGSLATGAHNGLLTIGCAADNCPVEVPVTLTVASPGPPGIYGVFDNITFAPQAAPGDVAVVLGEQLSTEPPVLATSVPLPTSLGGASVQVGGVAAPLYYSSPNQIAFQVPSGTAPGPGVMVQVQRAGEISGGFSVPVRYLDAQIAAVTDTAYSLLDAYHPAHAGGAIILWVIGLGPTVPPVPDGAAAPVSPLAKAVDSPVVQFGPNVTVNADFAGLSPGWVGLYQVNVTVPADMPSGNFSVKLAYPGPSNTVPLGIE